MSASRKPLSRPLASTPQAPSPAENGWCPPAARTASLMIWAQAATVSCGVRSPPYSGISLEASQPATAGCEPNRRTICPANQACRPTSHTSASRSRAARHGGSQFWPDMCPTMNVGTVTRPSSACRSRKSANRAVISSSITSGLGMKSGQKKKDRVMVSPWSRSTRSSAPTTAGS